MLFKVKLIFLLFEGNFKHLIFFCLVAYKMYEAGTDKTAEMLSGKHLQRICCSSCVGPWISELQSSLLVLCWQRP